MLREASSQAYFCLHYNTQRPNPKKNMEYGRDPLPELTLCLLQSRPQHIYHEQPYARVNLNPKPESTLSPSLGLWI